MQIVLLRPFSAEVKYSCYTPLGIACVGAALEKEGHDVTLLDMSVEAKPYRRLEELLLTRRPDIIGIGCTSVDFPEVARIGNMCKKLLPASKVLLGGPFPSSAPRIALSQDFVDIVVLGEGEVTTAELASKIDRNETLETVEGIGYKVNGAMKFDALRHPTNIDQLPFPARHLLHMDSYITSWEHVFSRENRGKLTRATNMIVTRGCPYGCIYCDKGIFGSKWRGRNPKGVVDEIELVVDTYNVNAIIFVDDIFDVNQKWVMSLCDEIVQRKLEVIWACNSRVNHANREMYQKMYASGCRTVSFGIEFGSQRMLDFIKKGTTVQQAREAVDIAKSTGLRANGFFMVGMLGEDINTIKQTLQLSRELELDAGQWSITSPIPGTKLFAMAEQEGLVSEESWWQVDRRNISTSLTRSLTVKQLSKLAEEAYWRFFWSRPVRRAPRLFCWFASAVFPILYFIFGHDMYRKFILPLENLRRRLGLPLP